MNKIIEKTERNINDLNSNFVKNYDVKTKTNNEDITMGQVVAREKIRKLDEKTKKRAKGILLGELRKNNKFATFAAIDNSDFEIKNNEYLIIAQNNSDKDFFEQEDVKEEIMRFLKPYGFESVRIKVIEQKVDKSEEIILNAKELVDGLLRIRK